MLRTKVEPRGTDQEADHLKNGFISLMKTCRQGTSVNSHRQPISHPTEMPSNP